MIGVSWDGTIANAVASTGVEGLETIVPITAISSWYDYTRGNGIPFYENHVQFLHEYVSNFAEARCRSLTAELQAGSDDATGNYNDWWVDRDYRPDASKITASVYVVHGLSDENVKTRQFGEWWDELVANGVERRIFLHQYNHIDPHSSFGTVGRAGSRSGSTTTSRISTTGCPTVRRPRSSARTGRWSTRRSGPRPARLRAR